MVGGFTGQILNVDLSTGKHKVEALDFQLARKYLGGRGYAAYLLYRNGAHVEPFSPESVIVLSTGPLTGLPGTGSKFVMVTRSPQTGLFLDSYSGGHMSAEIKYAGYDHIVIGGRCDRPSYLWIDDGRIEIRSAAHLWGKSSYDTETTIKKELGDPAVRVMSIGPGGENGVLYACVSTDYYHQAGRGGMGAVMGSKNLKAIAIRGSQGVKVADGQALLNLMRNEMEEAFEQSEFGANRIRYGTTYTTVSTPVLGIMPTRNFQSGVPENIEGLNCFTMREKLVVKDKACFGCQIPCLKYSVVTYGDGAGTKLVGPEYETIALLGSNVGVYDIGLVAKANLLCDLNGLDTISTGNTIGFAMECYEKGLLTKEDTGGLELKFGDHNMVFTLIDKIAHRDGIGDLLADGVMRAAEKIGKNSSNYAVHVKGMEIPAYDPRGAYAMGLAYATASRGGCHRRAKPVEVPRLSADQYSQFGSRGNATLVKRLQDFREVVHSALVCDPALRFGFEATLGTMSRLFKYTTGWDMSEDELRTLADRVDTLIRVFNVREGFDRKDDRLPARFLKDPLPSGPAKGKVVDAESMETMLTEYYTLRGWDDRGVPTRDTLHRLGLDEIAGDIA